MKLHYLFHKGFCGRIHVAADNSVMRKVVFQHTPLKVGMMKL